MIFEISSNVSARVGWIILCAFIAMGAAQSAKVVYNSLKEKRFCGAYFWSTGGMPSSHSATMISLLTSLGILEAYYEHGIGYEFAIALAFTVVVIYDAMGVRYEAGKHARMLNKIMEAEPKEVKESMGYNKEFKVLLGHKPKEVFWGIIVGFIVGGLGALIYILTINY
jgi:uncharacterized protein